MITFEKRRILDRTLPMAMIEVQNLPTGVQNCNAINGLFDKLEPALKQVVSDIKALCAKNGIAMGVQNGSLSPQPKSTAEQNLLDIELKKVEEEKLSIDLDAPLVLSYPGMKFKPFIIKAFSGIIQFKD